MAEFIGSRIALISKSEIRYVGTLREINSETATVSLEHVTCSGTEGRLGNPDQEIPASDQVYDGIVFRGSDVKDLRILAPPSENRPPQMPNDPAILQASKPTPTQPQPPPPQQQQQQQQPPPPPPNQFRGGPPYQQQNQFGYQGPPPNQFQQQPRFQGPGGPHGFPGSPGAVPGYGMGYGGPPPPGYGMGMPYGPPPGQGFPQHPHAPFPQQHPQQSQMPIGTPGAPVNQQRPPPQAPTGSKQGTPQPAGSQAPQPPPSKPAEASATSNSSAPATSAPPPPLDSKPPAPAAVAPSAVAQPSPVATATKAAQRANNRVAVPLPTPNAESNRNRPKPPVGQQAPAAAVVPQVQAPANATDAATAAVAAAMAKLAVNNAAANGNDNLAQKVSQMRAQDVQARGRGRGRGGAPRGGRRESAQKTVEVPKEDFDFETANAKFNKQELAKEAIATGSPIPETHTGPNGAAASAATSALNASINGHGADEPARDDDDVVIPAKPTAATAERGYDKKSSFFDNISSDLRDRVEQQQHKKTGAGGEMIDGRTMRREERSKNMETFGQGSVDSGGYRGRGRGRGRGFGRGGGRGYFGGGGRGRGRGGAEPAVPI